jgi:hypothetical protein
MDRRDPLMVAPERHGLGRLQKAARPIGEFL